MSDHDHNNEVLPEAYEAGNDSDINVLGIIFIGVIGALLTVVIVIWLKALYYETSRSEVNAKVAQYGAGAALSDVFSREQTAISQYRWVDPRAGTLAIPVDRAMELTVAEHAGEGEPGREVTQWGTSDENPTPGDLVLWGMDPSAGIGQMATSNQGMEDLRIVPGGPLRYEHSGSAGAPAVGMGKTGYRGITPGVQDDLVARQVNTLPKWQERLLKDPGWKNAATGGKPVKGQARAGSKEAAAGSPRK